MIWKSWASLGLGVLAAAFPLTRARAEAPPLRASVLAISDAWRNLQGGVHTGDAQVNSLELRLDAAGAAAGWEGLSASISLLGTASRGPTARLTGDLQTADNKDATTGVRLYEAWVRKSFDGGYLKAGVIDLNSEFNLTETAGVFVNGAQGLGLDLGQVGTNGPSVYPAPRLGFAAAVEGRITFKAGIFDGLTQAGGPHRPDTRTPERGALGVLEVSRGAVSDGRLAVGIWRHSAEYGSTLEALRSHPAGGGYVLAERTLWRGDDGRSLQGLVRFGTADPKTQQIARHLTADLVLNRPFLGRDGEALGLGVVSAQLGAHARGLRRDEGATAHHGETAVEVTYRAPLGNGFWLQPDIQYLVHPGAARGRSDAVLVGLRLGFAAAAP